jgi:hypothetical protein
LSIWLKIRSRWPFIAEEKEEEEEEEEEGEAAVCYTSGGLDNWPAPVSTTYRQE